MQCDPNIPESYFKTDSVVETDGPAIIMVLLVGSEKIWNCDKLDTALIVGS